MSDKYQLYIVRPQDINDNEQHYLITVDYCLLYTNNKPPKINKKITDMKLLPELAMSWLSECIEDIRLKYLADNQSEIVDKANAFAERLQKELAAERTAKGEVAIDDE